MRVLLFPCFIARLLARQNNAQVTRLVGGHCDARFLTEVLPNTVAARGASHMGDGRNPRCVHGTIGA